LPDPGWNGVGRNSAHALKNNPKKTKLLKIKRLMENTLMVSESVPPQTAGEANPYQPGSRLLMDQAISS
jgi:hypothetical protein